MMKPGFMRPHRRWLDEAAAYVDATGVAAERARFEAHMASCKRCSRRVEELTLVRSLLASLPPAPVPRSLRLTPEMLADSPARSARIDRPPPSRTPLRLAQFATVAALVAFGTVFALDRLSGGSSPQQASVAGPHPLAAAEASGEARSKSVPASPRAFAPLATTPTPAAVAPPAFDGVSGQSVASPAVPTPAPSAPARSTPLASATPQPPGTGNIQAAGPAASNTEASPARSVHGSRWYAPAEVGLAVAAALGVLATVLFARRQRRS